MKTTLYFLVFCFTIGHVCSHNEKKTFDNIERELIDELLNDYNDDDEIEYKEVDPRRKQADYNWKKMVLEQASTLNKQMYEKHVEAMRKKRDLNEPVVDIEEDDDDDDATEGNEHVDGVFSCTIEAIVSSFKDKIKNKKLELNEVKSNLIGLFNEQVDTFSKLAQLPFPSNWSNAFQFKTFFTYFNTIMLPLRELEEKHYCEILSVLLAFRSQKLTNQNAIGLISQLQEKLVNNQTEQICEQEISDFLDLVTSVSFFRLENGDGFEIYFIKLQSCINANYVNTLIRYSTHVSVDLNDFQNELIEFYVNTQTKLQKVVNIFHDILNKLIDRVLNKEI